jgi:hypothetical protein
MAIEISPIIDWTASCSGTYGPGHDRDSVRISFGRMWQAVAETTGLDPVTIKAFLAFDHITTGANR